MRFWRAITKARTAAYLWFTLLEVLLSTAMHAGFAITIAASAVAREVLVTLRTEGAVGSAAGKIEPPHDLLAVLLRLIFGVLVRVSQLLQDFCHKMLSLQ